MIPQIIHYCWFGKGVMPDLAKDCIRSWHMYMPDWKYMLWSEDNFDIEKAVPYVREAYKAGKYAFVSDYVRLWALEQYGGLYMDVDFKVYQSFQTLLHNQAFAGYEGSKRHPVMMGVIASEQHGEWITKMLHTYDDRNFLLSDGQLDMRSNTGYLSSLMEGNGLLLDGKEKSFHGLHIYPVDYFCPVQTTGERVFSENTYCEHMGLNSWNNGGAAWKVKLLNIMPSAWRIMVIKLKRKLLG